jgi:hypothetical protein
MSRLLHLYPAAWRERYEAEVADLLEARPPGVRDRMDLIGGAVDAWRHPQLVRAEAIAGAAADRSRGRFTASILALLGGGAWAAGGLAMRAIPYDEALGYKDTTAAILLLVLGALLTGLAVCALARSLARPSRAIAATGAALVVFGLVLILPWPVMVIGFYGYLLATVLFGGALVTDESRPVGVVLAIAALAMFSFNTENDQALIAVPFGVIWMLFGLLALRARPVAGPAPAGA